MSPLEVLQHWFDKLPPEMRNDLGSYAAILGGKDLVPLFEDFASSDEAVSAFRAALNLGSDSPMATVGKTVAFSALVDFVFLKRSTKEDWNDVMAINDHAVELAKAEGDASFLATVERAGAGFALRGAMWIREAARWRGLRSSSLSNHAMSEWLSAELAARTRR